MSLEYVRTPAAAMIVEDAGRETVIKSRPGWRLVDWRELRDYRDLFRFLVWREIRVRYAQSVVGVGWAIIQPVASMIIFTFVFGRLAGIESDDVPYALFSLAGLVPWTYFSNAVMDGTNSLVINATIVNKIYFPRLFMPLSAIVAKLVDFAIAMVVLFGLMASYRVVPGWSIFLLPCLIVLMMISAAAISIGLSALAIQFRDVKHAMGFVVQLAMYLTPVVYPASLIPERYQLLYALNPMVGVIEGFRSTLLGTRPIPWALLLIGSLSSMTFLILGTLFFRRKERLFADVA